MTSAIYIYYTPSWQELADIVLPKVEAYAAKHGYIADIICTDWNVLPVGSYKMHILQRALIEYDFIWVLDLDTLITNPEIKFTDFVDNDHDIFIATDINGINAGSWIVRNTPESIEFIRAVINNFDAPEEQTIMKRYLNMVKVKYLLHPSINSYKYGLYGIQYPYGEWAPSDLLLHLPGLSLERRIEILKEMV